MFKNLFFFISLFIFSLHLKAQTDNYSGYWQMETAAVAGQDPILISLQIAEPEKNLLYPAQLQIKSGSFTAVYELLLVRKNNWELAISKNKQPITETPFSIGKYSHLINGIFDYSKDLKAVQSLTLRRINIKAALKSDIGIDSNIDQKKATALFDFLNTAPIKLFKLNNTAWQSLHTEAMLSSNYSPVYYGLKDTVILKTKVGSINLSGIKKRGNDVVSVTVNGRSFIELLSLTKKNYNEDILLDTGLNTLCFFAENFDLDQPNAGKLKLEFGKKNIVLDFNNREDSAANFIVVKLFFEQDRSKENSFQYYYSASGEPKLQANEKLISNLVSTSQQLTLALWDDAVEDGDSVSINIDGRWIVQGFPVKKNPQFIPVTLKPGHNTINFIADNLGTIPPNTSILEIIDGNKRKSFTLETTIGETNLLKIYYEVRPGN